MCGGWYNRNAIISRWLCVGPLKRRRRRQLSPSGESTDRALCRRRNAKAALPATALKNILEGLCAIYGASFEGLVAERARLAYSAHWRADDELPLTNFFKVLGERYPLPIVGG
jgi:hypothetical protein